MRRISLRAAGAMLALFTAGPAFAACQGGLLGCGSGGGSASLPRANVGGTSGLTVQRGGAVGTSVVAKPGIAVMPRGAGIVATGGGNLVASGGGNFGPGRR